MAKRRANNEGTIYKRADGTFEAKILIGWSPEGKPKYKYFRGKSQADVLARWEDAKGTIRTGTFTEPNRILFKDWLDTWLNVTMINSIKDTTKAMYENLIEKHIKPELGGIKITKIQTVHIQEFYNRMQKEGRIDKMKDKNTGKMIQKQGGLSAQTIRHIHKIISGALKQAVKERYLPINPADAVILPKIQEKEMQVLTADQVKTFIDTARKYKTYSRYYAAYILELYTGLRRGELLGLRWKDIDMKTGNITIVQQIVKVKSTLEIRDLKTKSSKRTIAIPDEVIDALKEHKIKKDEEYKLMGYSDIERKKMLTDGLVFTTGAATIIHPDNFIRNYKSLLKKCKLPNLRFHDMRHTFATLSLQMGVDIKTLQSDLGHASIETTLDRYGHVNEDMKRTAASKRSELMKVMTE